MTITPLPPNKSPWPYSWLDFEINTITKMQKDKITQYQNALQMSGLTLDMADVVRAVQTIKAVDRKGDKFSLKDAAKIKVEAKGAGSFTVSIKSQCAAYVGDIPATIIIDSEE